MHDKCTAVKTITIDLEAYETLARRKRPGQSFSEVIKEHLGRRGTGRDLAEVVARHPLSSDTLDALADIVKTRRRHRFRAPTL